MTMAKILAQNRPQKRSVSDLEGESVIGEADCVSVALACCHFEHLVNECGRVFRLASIVVHLSKALRGAILTRPVAVAVA